MEKLHLLNRNGSDAFHRDDNFKTESKILEKFSVDKENIIPEHQTQAAVAGNPNSNFCNFHEYLLKGDLETAMEVNCKAGKHIIASEGIENPITVPTGKPRIQSYQHYTWFWII